MSGFTGYHFDGSTSTPRLARVAWDAAARQMRVEAGGCALDIPFSAIRVGDPLGQAPRTIYLGRHGELQTDDHRAADELARALSQGRLGRMVFRLEGRYGMALVALLLSATIGWAGIRYLMPVAAAQAVRLIPAGVEAEMGRTTLETLDEVAFQPSRTGPSRQAAIRQALAGACTGAGTCPAYRLEFRGGGPVGANALALPGGIVVITDELIRLARDDSELIGVAAHELGHVAGRHTMRQVLASTGVILIAQVMLGDLGSLGDLTSGLPAWLLQASYSRDAEREADAYAQALMRRACLSPKSLAALLDRLERAHGGAGEGGMALLSTHPATRERIAALQSVWNPAPACKPGQ